MLPGRVDDGLVRKHRVGARSRTPCGEQNEREAGAERVHRLFRQVPLDHGIHSGMFSDWWKQTLLSLEGQDHLRLRRLLNPAFKQGVVQGMVPGFAELAHELVDGFSERGSVELVSEFAATACKAMYRCTDCLEPFDHVKEI